MKMKCCYLNHYWFNFCQLFYHPRNYLTGFTPDNFTISIWLFPSSKETAMEHNNHIYLIDMSWGDEWTLQGPKSNCLNRRKNAEFLAEFLASSNSLIKGRCKLAVRIKHAQMSLLIVPLYINHYPYLWGTAQKDLSSLHKTSTPFFQGQTLNHRNDWLSKQHLSFHELSQTGWFRALTTGMLSQCIKYKPWLMLGLQLNFVWSATQGDILCGVKHPKNFREQTSNSAPNDM